MMRRYQDFRQFVATAHDQGDQGSLKRLARRFDQESRREAAQQDWAAGGAAPAVDGADDDYATLIGNCQTCAASACSDAELIICGLVQHILAARC